MKFAHMADLHIGSWREPKLRELAARAFVQSLEKAVGLGVDFVLFAGDLFNTSLPAMDGLKLVVEKLKWLTELGIPLYIIAGSHDFSPSGRTMIEVLEKAGLVINVCKGDVVDGVLKLGFTIDKKTSVKITGMLGKRGMLDRIYYEKLDPSNLEKEEGYKIFMFHTAISELKPKHLEKMEAQPLSMLPKGFNYYAGGHVHHRSEMEYSGGLVTMPGALFPNNFAEVEKYSHGGFYFVEEDKVEWIPVKTKEHVKLEFDCQHKSSEDVERMILDELNNWNLKDAIVTIRFSGILSHGKPGDINFKTIFKQIYDRGAYFVMKNSSKLHSSSFEEIKIDTGSVEDVEENLIKEHLGQIKMEGDELDLTKSLRRVLDTERKEGEHAHDFEERMKAEIERVLGLD
jgi:DNA repair exonuclease SbcCD nuclease subunit